jgi:hypothetical protein
MARTTTIKLPMLDLTNTSPKSGTIKSRGRSNSIVKVEHIEDRSVEETQDRNVYVNINADWVNAKGELVARVW